jgi:hypothetical protein
LPALFVVDFSVLYTWWIGVVNEYLSALLGRDTPAVP